MSTGTLLAIVVPAVVVLALIAVAVSPLTRRRRLRERFGTEYERAVAVAVDRRAGERGLGDREKRHDSPGMEPLPAGSRDRRTHEWSSVREELVDRPGEAVHDADRLVTSLLHERGCPAGGFEQQAADLSGEHGRTLGHCRAAHEAESLTARSEAMTEQPRGAMVHYRALFGELLSDGGRPRHTPS